MARALAFGGPRAQDQLVRVADGDVTERQVWLAAYICRMEKYSFTIDEWPDVTSDQRRDIRRRGCRQAADAAADAFKERFGG